MKNKYCPICGEQLKKKIIKKGNQYRRSLKSFICYSCNYAEYESNEREQAITDGYLDNEIDIIK